QHRDCTKKWDSSIQKQIPCILLEEPAQNRIHFHQSEVSLVTDAAAHVVFKAAAEKKSDTQHG
ncbi:MAG: hypothetical protein KAU48_10690, partial [Candidatus Thorarchaeota archaeon]|nr:hypothetical protein [Candidatus Thorarchaeota archaeon]